jgi:hypothetical protein
MPVSDLQGRVLRTPQNLQQTITYGVYKGIVVDVRDPAQLGKIRVFIYSLMGDVAGINVDTIPWCEVANVGRQYGPPEIWDRAIVTFEAGNKKAPLVIGYWRANPAGRGKLPYSSQFGSEIRPEAWHSRGLYPEARIISADGPGNVLWTEAKLLSGKSLASLIQFEDTGGKEIKIRSFHKSATPYVQNDSAPSGVGALLNFTDKLTPTRDGLGTVTDPVSGSIEFYQQNVNRVMQSSTTDFTVDQMSQMGDNGIGVEQSSAGGVMHRTRQGSASLNLFNNSLALVSATSFLPAIYQTPRRWDQ